MIRCFAGMSPLRQALRRQSHRKIRVRIVLHQPRVGRNLVTAHRNMDIDSVPPRRSTSAPPHRMRSAARAIACIRRRKTDRLMVIADTPLAIPPAAKRCAPRSCPVRPRAWHNLKSHLRFPQDRFRAPSAKHLESRPPLIIWTNRHRIAPLNARPTGVRTEETITASRIVLHPQDFRRGRIGCPCPKN